MNVHLQLENRNRNSIKIVAVRFVANMAVSWFVFFGFFCFYIVFGFLGGLCKNRWRIQMMVILWVAHAHAFYFLCACWLFVSFIFFPPDDLALHFLLLNYLMIYAPFFRFFFFVINNQTWSPK